MRDHAEIHRNNLQAPLRVPRAGGATARAAGSDQQARPPTPETGAIELRASAGVALPLVRDAFRFGPTCREGECDGVFDRVDALIWSGTAGFGVSF